MKCDGSDFNSPDECKEYITQYYENIYKLPDNVPADFDRMIINFLGPDICNSPLVQDCKLSNAEADLLDLDISLQELDTSVREAKTRTACGSDGFSNLFIKKFWSLFRVPLHNFMLTCFRKKTY
jgi:hypothetical protein